MAFTTSTVCSVESWACCVVSMRDARVHAEVRLQLCNLVVQNAGRQNSCFGLERVCLHLSFKVQLIIAILLVVGLWQGLRL